MNPFILMIFGDLFPNKVKCNSFKINSTKYNKCVEQQKISDKILQLFAEDRKVLMQKYYELLEDTKVQEFVNIQMNILQRLNEDMDNYIDIADQKDILSEFIDSVEDVEFTENEFDGFNH